MTAVFTEVLPRLIDRVNPRSGAALGRRLVASRHSRCVSCARTLAVVAFALTLHGLPAGAQDQALDLRQSVQYALVHNANIASRRATLASAEAQFAKDHANEYPSVVGLLENQLAKQNNTSAGQLAQYGLAPANVFSQNTAQLGSQWTVYNGSNNQILAQRAKRQVESERDDLSRAEQQLAQDVNNAYWTVAVRRENVQLDSADEAYQQALLQVSRDSERVGRTAGVDVLRSQVNALRAQAALATAQSDEATARESLAQVIGAPPEQPFVIEDELPEPPLVKTPLDELITAAEANRADIAAPRVPRRCAAVGFDHRHRPLSGLGHQRELRQRIFTDAAGTAQCDHREADQPGRPRQPRLLADRRDGDAADRLRRIRLAARAAPGCPLCYRLSAGGPGYRPL